MRDEPEVWAVINTAKAVYGDDMGAFLCWLGVRLLEMHRILAEDGSLYLHIDHTAHAWVKTLLDAIFGKSNFQNEIVWYYGGGGAAKTRFGRKHDTILFYTKGSQWTFNIEAIREPHKWVDGQPRADGSERSAHGKIPDDVIVMHGVMPWAKERTGYPTQKPLALYERIIKASSNPGDLVLDPFCGCATTPVAAERLDRQWVGMDEWEGAHKMVLDRLSSIGFDTGDDSHLPSGRAVQYTDTPPQRTDRGETAALVLRTPTGKVQPRLPSPRSQHGNLLIDIGPYCQGCGADYGFDPRVLEVDHIRPRSDGGSDAFDNLTLLCPPCNKEKRDYYTLSYLQQRNRDNGYMKNEANLRMGRARTPAPRRRRR